MRLVIVYLASALVFLLLDAVVLTTVLRPLFEGHLGDWLVPGFRLGPAAAFYPFYLGVVTWLVGRPALREGRSDGWVLANGALLGAFAYGTYEFTNYATLARWHWQMVAVDLPWGMVLTALTALAGVRAARWLT